MAAYERRGAAPASGLRLLLGGVRWSAAATSAAAAAVLVIFSGALGSSELPLPGQAGLTAANAGVAREEARERPLEWERIHPLPSTVAPVRVVNDNTLSLIGWAPDLDGP